jgi:hypothetical protein
VCDEKKIPFKKPEKKWELIREGCELVAAFGNFDRGGTAKLIRPWA